MEEEITLEREPSKKKQRTNTKKDAKFERLDGTIIILYFGGSNNIFADCSNNADILDQEYRHYIENQ